MQGNLAVLAQNGLWVLAGAFFVTSVVLWLRKPRGGVRGSGRNVRIGGNSSGSIMTGNAGASRGTGQGDDGRNVEISRNSSGDIRTGDIIDGSAGHNAGHNAGHSAAHNTVNKRVDWATILAGLSVLFAVLAWLFPRNPLW